MTQRYEERIITAPIFDRPLNVVTPVSPKPTVRSTDQGITNLERLRATGSLTSPLR